MKKLIVTALASAMIASVATYAFADKKERQPHMQAALKHLEQALDQLQKATSDKGGHRVAAIGHVKEAIKSTTAGIEHDNKN